MWNRTNARHSFPCDGLSRSAYGGVLHPRGVVLWKTVLSYGPKVSVKDRMHTRGMIGETSRKCLLPTSDSSVEVCPDMPHQWGEHSAP